VGRHLPHSRGTILPIADFLVSTGLSVVLHHPQIRSRPNDSRPAEHGHNVYRRHEVSDRLLQLAALQAHVVTREQAVGHGMSRHSISRLVESGSWRRLARGLFLTVHWSRRGTRSHGAACCSVVNLRGSVRSRPVTLHQLLRQAPNPLDMLVPHQRRIEVPGPWLFIRERAGVRPARSVKEPPRLTVESTVLDLTDVRDAGEVVELVTTAVQRRLTTVKRLRHGLDARARHRHRALLHDLLADVGAGAESPIELRYLRDVERPHGLPKGSRQQSRSGLPYMSDVDYTEFGLIVELDGRAGHEGIGRFRDMDRDNRHALVDALPFDSGTMILLPDRAPLPSRSTVH
jgi:Transcriptional regulator, AbiEi antitoxin